MEQTNKVVGLHWRCKACLHENEPRRTNCTCCFRPRLNGSWPKDTFLQRRLRILRKEQLDLP